MTVSLTVISSMAMRQILVELADLHARRSAVQVALESVGGVEAARRVRAGEVFDVVLLAAGAMAQLDAGGHLLAGSRVDIAHSGMAAAVRKGAPKPSFGTEADVRRAVMQAGRIGYSTGPSGDHLLGLLQRWGIAETVEARLVRAPTGVPVARLVADGAVDLGFQQLSELLGEPGVKVLDALPSAIQATTVFTAGIAAICRSIEPALAFVRFLASEEAQTAKRHHGMEPADGTSR